MMQKTTDFTLLEFATKGKNFVAEIATQTRENYYSADTRIPIKILVDYFKTYKQVPSLDTACELAEAYPKSEHEKIRHVLREAYNADKAVLTDGDFPYLITKLKNQYNDFYIKESIKIAGQRLVGQYDLEELNEYIKKMAMEIGSLKSAQMHAHGPLNESAHQRLLAYKELKENPELARGIFSGYRDLDAITNGFKESELILVSGPTGSGKSIFLMSMALNAWLGKNKVTMPETEWDDSGKNVWFVTIENPKKMLERRIDSNLAGVVCNHIRDGQLTLDEEPLFKQSLKFQHTYGEKKRFEITDFSRGVSMAGIEAEYEKICSIFEPDIIVIDYLGIMKAINPTGVDWMDQGSIAADMHEFCRVARKPVLTASQMKAALRTQQGPKQIVGDPESVARSKMITDNVNLNLQIEKGKDFNIETYVRLHVAKNRDGETGKVIELVKEYWRMRVADPDANFLVRPNNDSSDDDE